MSPSTTKTHPLSNYAARYWIYHAQSAETLHRLMVNLLTSENTAYRNWLTICNPDDDYGISTIPSPLYYTSLARLKGVSVSLVINRADTKAHGGFYGNALQAASSEEYDSIVQMLLENGTNPNAQDGHPWMR